MMHKEIKFVYKFVILVAVLLLYRAICLVTSISGYCAEQYLISYKYGFIARGFMGTLLSFKQYWTTHELFLVGLVIEIILSIAFLLLVKKSVERVDSQQADILAFIIVLYTMSPMSPAYTYLINNFARFDAVLLLLALCQLILLYDASLVKGFISCVLSVICILVHPVYVFTYFAVEELALLYQVKKQEKKRAWVILFLVNATVVGMLFLYFEYGRGVSSAWTQDSMYQDMQSRTDFDLGTNFYGYLNDWYFGTVDSQMTNTVAPFIPVQPIMLCITIITLLPFEILCFRTWFKGIKKDEPANKILWICMACSFVIFIPAFVIQIDWGRWCAAYYAGQLLLLIFMYADGDEIVVESLDEAYAWCKMHKVLALVMIAYLCSLGVFKEISQLEIGEFIYSNVQRLLQALA